MKKEAVARLAGGNIKLGNMATFSKLYGDMTHHSKKWGDVVGSCGGHCAGCKNACYVRRSYRYPSVVDGHARNTLAFRENIVKAFSDIDGQLSRKRTPFDVVRINQSGEIETAFELLLWVRLAQKHPETRFYVYTKNYEAVYTLASGAEIVPDNFTILISVWHEYGLKEYRLFENLPYIKAFAYMDGYDYEEAGLHIETTCKAYEGGKLNHAITCDKCKKCFAGRARVIGCHDH